MQPDINTRAVTSCMLLCWCVESGGLGLALPTPHFLSLWGGGGRSSLFAPSASCWLPARCRGRCLVRVRRTQGVPQVIALCVCCRCWMRIPQFCAVRPPATRLCCWSRLRGCTMSAATPGCRVCWTSARTACWHSMGRCAGHTQHPIHPFLSLLVLPSYTCCGTSAARFL